MIETNLINRIGWYTRRDDGSEVRGRIMAVYIPTRGAGIPVQAVFCDEEGRLYPACDLSRIRLPSFSQSPHEQRLPLEKHGP